LHGQSLIRVRYGPFVLPPQLKRGMARELKEVEIKALMRELENMPRASEKALKPRKAIYREE
jgi:23S rRNA pseudouridine2605 synthase